MLNQPRIQRQSYLDIGKWYLDVCEQAGSLPWSVKHKHEKFGCDKKDMYTFRDMGLDI
jgi:hypothetical protein